MDRFLATEKHPISPDWVFSNNSNVHVARDMEWFVSYTPFQTRFSAGGSGNVEVKGIGTVEIPTELENGMPRTIRLTDVLYAPTGVCNIMGNPILNEYDISMRFGENATKSKIIDKHEIVQGTFERGKTLVCLKIETPPFGPYTAPSKFDDGTENIHYIRANWESVERRRWLNHKT